MNQEILEKYTKFEIARIIGARALQLAMDAPILAKISESELKEMNYDPLRIAEKELESGALPISIHRPTPKRGTDKLKGVKEEAVSDEELKAKEKEVEKEIIEGAEELGFSKPEESETMLESDDSEEQ